MNRTQIEWVKNPDGSQGYTWNPVTGCLNHENGLCKGGGFPCYAYRLAHGRLKQRYLANGLVAYDYCGDDATGQTQEGLKAAFGDPFYPRFWEERLYHPWGVEPKGIFVCDMSDLFGIGIPEDWTRTILDLCRKHEQNRYYLLTKQPQNLTKFSPFPENCWVGVTATDYWKYVDACNYLSRIQASVKFLSLEPLLSWDKEDKEPSYFFESGGVSWLIIGACTGTWQEMAQLCLRCKEHTLTAWGKRWTAQPRIEDLREIVEAADKAGVKVFLKDNLRPLLIPEDCSKPNYLTEDIFWASEKAQLRQEMPK